MTPSATYLLTKSKMSILKVETPRIFLIFRYSLEKNVFEIWVDCNTHYDIMIYCSMVVSHKMTQIWNLHNFLYVNDKKLTFLQ